MFSESVDRETLYELVWTIPLTKLAVRFGVSDVAMKKVCKKLQVPVPGVGYWAKVNAGHVQERKPLPEATGNVPHTHFFQQNSTGVYYRPQKSEVRPPVNATIKVEPELVRPHRLVANTLKALARQKPDIDNMLIVTGHDCLDVRVSPLQMDRALRILDAVVKGLDDRGYSVSAGVSSQYHTSVTVDGVELGFRLKERSTRVKRQQQQLPDKRGLTWERTTDLLPTGELRLEIMVFDYIRLGVKTTWSDGKMQRLEACLDEFVVGLRVAAKAKAEYEAKRERERREDTERAIRRQIEEQRRREEEERIKELLRQVDLWIRSQQVRAFVATFKDNRTELDVGTAKWLEWAEGVADRMDPLLKAEGEMRKNSQDG